VPADTLCIRSEYRKDSDMSCKTYGPVELRIRWMEDDEQYDWGDIEPTQEDWNYLDQFGVMGCVLQTREPACACCGRTQWEVAESLWSIVGDDSYHREIERELMAEVAAS
jgi:hypothetical protein